MAPRLTGIRPHHFSPQRVADGPLVELLLHHCSWQFCVLILDPRKIADAVKAHIIAVKHNSPWKSKTMKMIATNFR